MTPKIFIDGAAGTTGLGIRERLKDRTDISLISLSDLDRKNPEVRSRALNDADLVILCLPDDAARQSVAMVTNQRTRIIDASSAHRVAQGWTYGFAELETDGYARIGLAKHLSNPGCWPTGFLAIVKPLVRAQIIPNDYPLTVSGISGYSGGGKTMIGEFENQNSPDYTMSISRLYALDLAHKHVAEMQTHAALTHPPLFTPSVGRFYRGMLVEVPLQLWALPVRPSVRDIHAVLERAYPHRPFVNVASLEDAAAVKTLDAEIMAGSNSMTIYVFANERTGQARLVAAFDNLGKGASGAAVQNMNIMLAIAETHGL